MKILFYLLLFILLSISVFAECSSPPIVMEISGTIKDVDGSLITKVVNVTFFNINQSTTNRMQTDYDNPSRFKISVLSCNVDETATLTLNNFEHVTEVNISPLGINAVESILNMTYSNLHPPIFFSMPETDAYENEEYSYEILTEDYNNQPLTLTLIESPDLMSISGNTISFTPNQTHVDNSPYNIVINASDGVSSSIQQYSLIIINKNDAPTIISTPTLSSKVNNLYTYQINASDKDNETFIYSIIEAPINVSINSQGQLTWTPSVDERGNNNIVIQLSDGELYDLQEWEVIVGPENNNDPIISSTPQSNAYIVYEYTYQVIASDSDNDALMYYIPNSEATAYMTGTGLMYFTPSSDDFVNSPLSFQINAVDVNGGLDIQTFEITVLNSTPESQQPVFNGSLPKSSNAIIGVVQKSSNKSVNNDIIIDENSLIGEIIYEDENAITIDYTAKSEIITSIIASFNKESNNSRNPKIYFVEFNSKPDYFKTPSIYVYQYFQITNEINDSILNHSLINFNIDSSFFNDNQLLLEDITLLVYNGSDWEELETKHVKTDSSSLTFQSRTSYFSYFAIGIKKEIITEIRYKPAPGFRSEDVINIAGKVYSRLGIFQSDRMTKYKISVKETGKQYLGLTGARKEFSKGEFFSQIHAEIGDTIIIEVLNDKGVLVYSKEFSITSKDAMNINIRTSISESIKWKLILQSFLMILFITFLVYKLELFGFKKQKDEEKDKVE